MCISAVAATLLAAGAGAAATVYSVDQSRKQANQSRDAATAAAEKVDTTATQTANARLAQRRRALASNSLVTDQSAGMASAGRATLGGG